MRVSFTRKFWLPAVPATCTFTKTSHTAGITARRSCRKHAQRCARSLLSFSAIPSQQRGRRASESRLQRCDFLIGPFPGALPQALVESRRWRQGGIGEKARIIVL